MLPNLIVIGAAKCGTSALYRYLSQHPEIFMSRKKELHFFSDEATWQHGSAWYESWFADARTPIAGEASPQYTWYPRRPGVPERMHSVIPDARLIYIVRDPLARLVAAYVEGQAVGLDPSWEETTALSPLSDAVWASSYATQIERYLALYPSGQVLVLAQEALLGRRRDTLREVFRFLGVDETFDSPRFDEVKNPSNRKRRMRVHASWLPRSIQPQPTGRLPWRLRAGMKRAGLWPLSAAIEPPRLEGELRRVLAQQLGPEAERLRKLTGKEFAEWSV